MPGSSEFVLDVNTAGGDNTGLNFKELLRKQIQVRLR
jgi:hypothetical protein